MKEKQLTVVHCPGCGFRFAHDRTAKGKLRGGVSGATTGGILGAKVGIVGGPLGAISGTVPGAVLGAILGTILGNKFDRAKCSKCGVKFEIPRSLG
jgi:outer membrane lipoprotein SlyB